MIGKAHYFFFYLIFTILCLALIHWIFIFFMNITSVKTIGMSMGEHITNYEMHSPTGRTGLSMGQTHYSSIVITRELKYRYVVNDKHYESTRISNVLIFPNPIIEDDNAVIVYYNRFFNSYSVLAKLDFKYFVLNLIPNFVLFFVMLFIKKTYMKETKFEDLIRNYFKSFIGSGKPND